LIAIPLPSFLKFIVIIYLFSIPYVNIVNDIIPLSREEEPAILGLREERMGKNTMRDRNILEIVRAFFIPRSLLRSFSVNIAEADFAFQIS